MLPKPDVGQKVRLEGREGQFIVKSVSMDGGLVDIVAETDRNIEIVNVPCVDLLFAEGESPD
jgi:hypothetical protein